MQASNRLLARLASAASIVLGMVVMIAIIIGTVPLLIESISRGYYIGEQGIFTFPEWPIKGMVVLGSAPPCFASLCAPLDHWLRSDRDPV